MQTSTVKRPMRPSSFLINAAAFVIVVAGLKLAAPLVTQILLIIFLTIIVTPLYFQMVKWRFPKWLALVILIFGLTVAVTYGLVAVTQALTQFAKQIPSYHSGLRNAVAQLTAWFAVRDIIIPDGTFNEIMNAKIAANLTKDLVTFGGGLLSKGFIILLVVVFIICEVATLPRKLRAMRWMDDDLWNRMLHVVSDVRHYMSIKTAISAATGVLIYAGLLIMGVDSALLLGLTAFVLNYIPSIGSVVAAIPAVLIAYIGLGVWPAVAVSVMYLVVNQLLGTILEPKIMGNGFGVSPVIILLSLLFWGWVLGPVGMLLSVPLTMGVRVMFASIKELAENP